MIDQVRENKETPWDMDPLGTHPLDLRVTIWSRHKALSSEVLQESQVTPWWLNAPGLGGSRDDTRHEGSWVDIQSVHISYPPISRLISLWVPWWDDCPDKHMSPTQVVVESAADKMQVGLVLKALYQWPPTLLVRFRFMKYIVPSRVKNTERLHRCCTIDDSFGHTVDDFLCH